MYLSDHSLKQTLNNVPFANRNQCSISSACKLFFSVEHERSIAFESIDSFHVLDCSSQNLIIEVRAEYSPSFYVIVWSETNIMELDQSSFF